MGEKQGHTPGPWVSDEAEGEWAVGDADGRVVAYLHQDDIDLLSEREANARLIAAAPDLLEAADHIDRTATDIADDMVVISGSAYRLMRAAIAKATGDSDAQ